MEEIKNMRKNNMNDFRIRLKHIAAFLLLLLVASPTVIFAQDPPADPAPGQNPPSSDEGNCDKSKGPREGFCITGLPLVSFNSDDGFGYGLRIYGTNYRDSQQYAPYFYQAFAQYYKTTRGYEYHEFKLDVLKFLGTPLRVTFDMGLNRTLNAQYYGYGNYHDIQRQNQIKKGEIPINENTPNSRDLYQIPGFGDNFTVNQAALTSPPLAPGTLNPGQRILREKQDKYFNYDLIRPFFMVSTEDFIGDTNFKWFAGLRGQSYRVQTYGGDIEKGQAEKNIKTLFELEQPKGFNAVDHTRYANGVRFALAYDSRPRTQENDPHSGIFSDIHYEGMGTGTGSAYSFYRVTATYRQYIEVIKDIVLAFRLQGQRTVGDAPFFEIAKITTMRESADGLGGEYGIRGYNANQFVDRVMGVANGEIRAKVASEPWLGGMDFVLLGYYDVGRVAPTTQEMTLKGLHQAVGGGLRLVWQTNTIVNISYGKSQYSSYLTLSFGHMF